MQIMNFKLLKERVLKRMTIKDWLEREKKKDEIFEAEAKTAEMKEFHSGQIYILNALLHLLPTFDKEESNG